ncbi:unnamed protein product [Adineta ricciae]|uniref:A-kinase anchor protein 7-like phosphoesterase domain-containing protein n=1 Tax=Adineta ricciae TaxID=249248 RepID=A0A813UCP5_ADIRI|nr:unnamed protein product [Adineta ricciae]CAF1519650.1 unnamed protein product [Adineta ricciae]
MSAELTNIYNQLYTSAIDKIQSDQYETDGMIDSLDDKRFGITLIIKPNEQIKDEIQKFLAALRRIEPDQYYYPSSDIHITVLPIISCHDGFQLDQISIQDYADLIRENLSIDGKLEIKFQGITASSSCIMIQGFPQQNSFNEVRNKLKSAFKASSLQQDIDKRYLMQAAHATAVRFRKPFVSKEEFLKVLEDYRNYNFGTMTVNEMELVFNDWYLKENIVQSLSRFQM